MKRDTKQINIDNWLYRAERRDEVYDFNIINPRNEKAPQVLYKFYALSKNSVDALTHLYVYASHPEQLNDPFDCCKDILEIDSESDFKHLWQNFYLRFCDEYKTTEERKNVSNEAFRMLFYRKCGILCLTPDKDNEQMWSLYALNTGFRLGFRVSNFPFKNKGPFPIHYREQLPTIHTSECNIETVALVQTNIKHRSWGYEKEWRLLISNPDGMDMKTFGPLSEWVNSPDDHDRKFRYPLTALDSVTLGVEFFQKSQLEYRLFATESEMSVVYPKECLETKVLDFLNEVQIKYPLKVFLASKTETDTFEDIPVKVMKLSKYTYHFIELDN